MNRAGTRGAQEGSAALGTVVSFEVGAPQGDWGGFVLEWGIWGVTGGKYCSKR